MRIRFQADADLKHQILYGTLRREPSVDFRSAGSVPLDGLADPAVLALAANDSRVLVSHDVSTMEHHFREFTQHRRSPGLILIPQRRVTLQQAIDGLVLIWEVLDAGEMNGSGMPVSRYGHLLN